VKGINDAKGRANNKRAYRQRTSEIGQRYALSFRSSKARCIDIDVCDFRFLTSLINDVRATMITTLGNANCAGFARPQVSRNVEKGKQR
jgi:hypothetical protein